MDQESSNRRKNKKRKLSPPSKCIICLELIEYRKDLTFITCGHFYHDECINKWLEKKVTCPICRIPIFIQDFEQLEKYRTYLSEQKISDELRRRNLPNDDNSIALMFLRDRHLFPKAILELEENNCYNHLLEIPEEPSFEELYGEGFDSDEDIDIPPPPSRPLPNLLTYYPSEISNILNSSSTISNIVRSYNPLDINRRIIENNSVIGESSIIGESSDTDDTAPLIHRPVAILRRNILNSDNNTSEIRRRVLRRSVVNVVNNYNSSYNSLFNSRTITNSSYSSSFNISPNSSFIQREETNTSRITIRLPLEYNVPDENQDENQDENSFIIENVSNDNLQDDPQDDVQDNDTSQDDSQDDSHDGDIQGDNDEFEKYVRYEHLYQAFDDLENSAEYTNYDEFRDYDDYRVYQNNLHNPEDPENENENDNENYNTLENNNSENDENEDSNLYPTRY